MLGSRSDAEDVVQDAWFRACEIAGEALRRRKQPCWGLCRAGVALVNEGRLQVALAIEVEDDRIARLYLMRGQR